MPLWPGTTGFVLKVIGLLTDKMLLNYKVKKVNAKIVYFVHTEKGKIGKRKFVECP
jgi:hypothetical protein